ncbi:MAG: PEP-CTERM sorting domain-containing protein [Burkholderiales bacterium]|jgi:hypothetical protein|nr:PEP-CTERM sorting domain-containing protein [Burkholderiales bacterium]
MKKLLLAAALAAAGVDAHAITVTTGGFDDPMTTIGQTSTVTGALMLNDFDGTWLAGIASYTGGTIVSGSGSVSAAPPDAQAGFDTSKYLHVGPGGNQGAPTNAVVPSSSPATVTFLLPTTYFGFWWGSPDEYNVLEITSSAGTKTITGGDVSTLLGSTANGDRSKGMYVNIATAPGETLTSVVFKSPSNAFETDNHMVVAVPEPSTYAAMGLGLGLAGFAAARRRKSAA